MEGRVIKVGNFWEGQLYGSLDFMGIEFGSGWFTVTSRCFTKIGAKMALKIYAAHEKSNGTEYLDL